MKKILAVACAAFSLAACNNNETGTTTMDTTGTYTDTMGSAVAVDTSMSSTTTSNAYSPKEGDVIYTEKKVKVWRNGEWVVADREVEMDNGVVVYRDGRVRKNGKEIELKEGEVVDRTGNFFDRSGRAIENAWDATKEGVKDAGKAIGKTAKKAGDKIEKAVEPDNKENRQ